jgi:predicted RNA-binding Zn ribbon-like protein
LAELARQWADIENLVTRTDRPLARLGQYDDAMDMGASLRTAPFLTWIADRLVQVHGESENVDFVQSLRERTEALKQAREEE